MEYPRNVVKFVNCFMSATLAFSLAAVISFICFMMFKFSVTETLIWMLVTGLLAFGGTFIGTFIAQSVASPAPAQRRPAAV